MPCACQGKSAAARDTFDVVFDVVAKSGKVVYSSPSRPTADAVARRYPESQVVARGKNATAAPTATPAENKG